MRVVEGVATVADVDDFVERLGAIGEEFGCAVQALDARLVAGHDYLRAAVERANRAVRHQDTIADDRAVEILCYAAGRRQIERALEMGVRAGEQPVAVVVDGDPDGGGADEGGAASAVRELLAPRPTVPDARDVERIRAFFRITDAELGATDASLEDLVIERVALLVVEK